MKSNAEKKAQEEIKIASSKALSTAAWVATCLNEIKRNNDIVITEMVFPLHLLDMEQPASYFGMSPAGGLGWGLGASIGLKMAKPDCRVIAIVGDGGYMFGNPTPAHHVCEAHNLPVLTIILNNSMWGAVRRATLGMYPDGMASRSNAVPLTHLKPSPRFEHVVEACGGYGERVDCAAELPAALRRALKVVDTEKRQAVLNVICEYSDSTAAIDAKR